MRKFLAIGKYEAAVGKEREQTYGVFDSLEETIQFCLQKDDKGKYVNYDYFDEPIERITEIEFEDGADWNYYDNYYKDCKEIKTLYKCLFMCYSNGIFRTEEEIEEMEMQQAKDAEAKWQAERQEALISGETLRNSIFNAIDYQFGAEGTRMFTDIEVNNKTDEIMKLLGF